jgi:hypothetical protein
MAYLRHIYLKSEPPGESIYENITLLFLEPLDHTDYFQLLCVRSQNYTIFWEIAISRKLDFHQKPIFVRVMGIKRNSVEGWIF